MSEEINFNKTTKISNEKLINQKSKSIQKKKSNFRSLILLLVINILLLAFSVFLILEVPKKAEILKNFRTDEQKIKESKNVDVMGLEYKPTKEKVEKLEKYFPDESGIIRFIEEMENFESQKIIKNFSIVNQEVEKDKTGAPIIPFIVEIEGSWEDINRSLQEFEKLPYLIRPINIEAKLIDLGKINFKYGGFLYVSDKLAKNR